MNKHPVDTIDVHQLKHKLDEQPGLSIIDVRELNEWQEVHIPGALHRPKNQLPETIATDIPDKSQPIYLHCRSGIRSMQAAEQLSALGYQHVYSVDGGIVAWEEAGYPVRREE